MITPAKLKKLRGKITQVELAEASGYSVRQISNLENGNRAITKRAEKALISAIEKIMQDI